MSDSTIVEAKREYTQQLCDKLYAYILEGFVAIWSSCKTGENDKPLKTFQEKISMIPKWNQDIIDNEYKRIVKNTGCEWLDKLIEAVFVSNVKVLSTIRVGKTKSINITLPDTKNFIHKCYIETARKLWSDPCLIDDRDDSLTNAEIRRNTRRLENTIKDCIDKTVSNLIPIQTILESYLNEIDSDSERSDPEPDISDEDETTDIQEVKEPEKTHEEDTVTNRDFFMEEPIDLEVTQGKDIGEFHKNIVIPSFNNRQNDVKVSSSSSEEDDQDDREFFSDDD